jgi:hypothetical protein
MKDWKVYLHCSLSYSSCLEVDTGRSYRTVQDLEVIVISWLYYWIGCRSAPWVFARLQTPSSWMRKQNEWNRLEMLLASWQAGRGSEKRSWKARAADSDYRSPTAGRCLAPIFQIRISRGQLVKSMKNLIFKRFEEWTCSYCILKWENVKIQIDNAYQPHWSWFKIGVIHWGQAVLKS